MKRRPSRRPSGIVCASRLGGRLPLSSASATADVCYLGAKRTFHSHPSCPLMDPETDLRPEVIVPARSSSSQQLDLECAGRRKTMPETDKVFAGSSPENYDRYLVPLIFENFAQDIAQRVAALSPSTILETAAGSGVVTPISCLTYGIASRRMCSRTM